MPWDIYNVSYKGWGENKWRFTHYTEGNCIIRGDYPQMFFIYARQLDTGVLYIWELPIRELLQGVLSMGGLFISLGDYHKGTL